MSNIDLELLAVVSKQSFFRHQPQPLIDLLNKRGIVGRPAEVFWTYFHWGFQNGSFQCQLSSAYVAELLFTDVRTVQRANERLQEAGFITRARAKKKRGSYLEAPAITTITIPDEDARTMLAEAPHRGVKRVETISEPQPPAKECTVVNSKQVDLPGRSSTENPKPPSPTPAKINNASPSKTPNARSDFSEIKGRLPEKIRQIHDVCMVKAEPGVFRRVLDELDNISESDAEVLMKPLRSALELKQSAVSKGQRRKLPMETTTPTDSTLGHARKRPNHPRPIPETAVSLINRRLKASTPHSIQNERKISDLAREIIYSITIGTMRGVDIMHAINATIKLIATKKWSRPRGMPDGWCFEHVVAGTA